MKSHLPPGSNLPWALSLSQPSCLSALDMDSDLWTTGRCSATAGGARRNGTQQWRTGLTGGLLVDALSHPVERTTSSSLMIGTTFEHQSETGNRSRTKLFVSKGWHQASRNVIQSVTHYSSREALQRGLYFTMLDCFLLEISFVQKYVLTCLHFIRYYQIKFRMASSIKISFLTLGWHQASRNVIQSVTHYSSRSFTKECCMRERATHDEMNLQFKTVINARARQVSALCVQVLLFKQCV
uniref:Uncharacterized protein n=1 Tax=Salix viminalis TaxID=40686 RepID=A0A6N2LZ23_SALVM